MFNLLIKYRAAQRRIRTIFNKYTETLCPVCPEPCCRKPSKVGEFDVMLAESCGCTLPAAEDAISALVDRGMDVLLGKSAPAHDDDPPCDYLVEDTCAFPGDLRPFGCVQYVCPFMKKAMAPAEMREMRRLLHRFGVIHRQLIDAVSVSRKG